jgi:hypothetical protein
MIREHRACPLLGVKYERRERSVTAIDELILELHSLQHEANRRFAYACVLPTTATEVGAASHLLHCYFRDADHRAFYWWETYRCAHVM